MDGLQRKPSHSALHPSTTLPLTLPRADVQEGGGRGANTQGPTPDTSNVSGGKVGGGKGKGWGKRRFRGVNSLGGWVAVVVARLKTIAAARPPLYRCICVMHVYV